MYPSNQVIGEADVAVQYHYGVSKTDARVALESTTSCGLLDRIVADDYRRTDLMTLTLDRKMASLPHTRRL